MTYRFRVSLPGVKGFARVYEVNGQTSLYAFHKQMLLDMEFPQDQLVLFKAFDAAGNLLARYATIDLGDGSIEHIRIDKAVKLGVTRYEYFYDTTNRRSVTLTLEEELPKGTVAKVELLESKGPVPQEFLNGYVAYEDLPAAERRHFDDDDSDVDFDDDDDDDEDEDEDDFGDENFGDEDERDEDGKW